MIQLMLNRPLDAELATDQTVFGGRPSAPQGRLMWPHCRWCKGAMQFMGQLRVDAEGGQDDALLLMFMCRNRPGMCHQGEAESGGNAVLMVGTQDLQLVDPPPTGKTLRATRYGATVTAIEVPAADEETSDYLTAAMGWVGETGQDARQVLGQLGGTAHWEELDETPTCTACGERMLFTALLEQGPDRKTEMNFGGGWAYVFRCACAAKSAKLLLQC